MPKKKFYAVAIGRKPGIYTEWSGEHGAQRQIIRFSGQNFKGFETLKEAEAYYKEFSRTDQNGTNTSEENPDSSCEAGQSQHNGRIVIYTDGGCINNPGPGGYGAVISDNGNTKELSGGYRLTTNNRMELMACIEALNSLKSPTSATLYSDSKYVVDGITKGWAKSWRSKGWIKSDRKPAINPDLWARLLDLCDKHDVVFQWVKGHAGIDGNERCDELANEAILQGNLLTDIGYEGSSV
jgi:ribonuclease HI